MGTVTTMAIIKWTIKLAITFGFGMLIIGGMNYLHKKNPTLKFGKKGGESDEGDFASSSLHRHR